MNNIRETKSGVIAAILFFLAMGWGLLLVLMFMPFYSFAQLFFFVLILGPGYLLTAGYGYRSFCFPALVVRQQLWIASILVQGLWLLMLGISGGPTIFSAWWLFATVASVVALVSEPAETAQRCG